MHHLTFLVPFAYGMGGIPRTVFTVANEMARRGHEVEVMTLLKSEEQPYFHVHPDITLSWVFNQVHPDDPEKKVARPRKRAGAKPELRELDSAPSSLCEDAHPYFSALVDRRLENRLSRIEQGIVVTTRPEFAVASARWTGPKVVTIHQEHMSITARKKGLRQAMLEVSRADAEHRIDAFLSLTDADLERWRALLEPSPIRFGVIPNATPFTVDRPAPLENKVVLAAGRLTHQKGFDRLVAAFEPITRSHPEWQLHIYGHGEDEPALRAQVDRLGIADQVHLPGITTEFEQVLTEASVYAMSSRFEGLPMVLLEAMSKGVPPVSFDCPEGPRQLIQDGTNGLLVPEGDVLALTSGLTKLIEDVKLRRALGAEAMRTADDYSITGVADQWESLFDELTRARRKWGRRG